MKKYEYINDFIYFTVRTDRSKAKNIEGNTSVAYTVDEDYTDLGSIKAVEPVKMTGCVSLIY